MYVLPHHERRVPYLRQLAIIVIPVFISTFDLDALIHEVIFSNIVSNG